MNTNNFKTFVETLEALPASIKGDEVNIGSFLKPDTCIAMLDALLD